MGHASKKEINAFLKRCRKIIETSFIRLRRAENEKTIRELGLTNEQVKEVICSLTVEYYSSGPTPHHHTTDLVWIFGKQIKNREVYVKILISETNDPGELIDTVFCQSFHFAKHDIHYPYQPKKK